MRWLEQAEHNLEVAEHNLKLKAKFYSDACFMAEQPAQVGLKAFTFIIYHERRLIWEHSIQRRARPEKRVAPDGELFKEIIRNTPTLIGAVCD